jgi:hypothetical protein
VDLDQKQKLITIGTYCTALPAILADKVQDEPVTQQQMNKECMHRRQLRNADGLLLAVLNEIEGLFLLNPLLKKGDWWGR